MKIGIIGSGIVGRVLASAFLKEGYDVMIGSRDPKKNEITDWVSENKSGKAGTFKETAEFGEILVLAVTGMAVGGAISLAGEKNFNGKVVIDATNPIAPEPPENGVLKFFTSMNESLMERNQALVPGAKMVKAFSCVGNPLMYKPDFGKQLPTMFICGNDPSAKETVTVILKKFGWETSDMGAVQAARAIEPLCILWCIPGMINNQWYHAFKLLKK